MPYYQLLRPQAEILVIVHKHCLFHPGNNIPSDLFVLFLCSGNFMACAALYRHGLRATFRGQTSLSAPHFYTHRESHANIKTPVLQCKYFLLRELRTLKRGIYFICELLMIITNREN